MLPARFTAKFIPEPNSGCWLWLSMVNSSGYGEYHVGRGNGPQGGISVRAHRFAYEATRGPIPPGMVLDHRCRTRCCVNPAHLEPVSSGANTRRGLTGSNMSSRTHCPAGHPYDDANTRRWNGRRICRACDRVKQARKRARKETR